MKPRLLDHYQKKVLPVLKKEMGNAPDLAIPTLDKIIVSIGVGDAAKDKGILKTNAAFLAKITGQKPIITKARKSVATFSLRKGQPIGLKVTLRGQKMWSFLDRLISLVLPLVRDFRGVSPKSFDQNGNYNLGLREQIIFPEVSYEEVDKKRGVRVTLVTSTSDAKLSKRLLELLGVPFTKENQTNRTAASN
ncbi:MAG: 50S ribosomal protein L5 [bacterium]|nr:50S ribosomal protein L5 [bacterium]